MPTYLHPGVYIEEIPSGAKPIEGVSTSVTAFVGEARRGPADEANLIGKLDDYLNEYGGIHSENDHMGLAVQSFYANGGGAAYICRLAGDGSAAATASINGEGVVGSSTTANPVLEISAKNVGDWGNDIYFQVIKPDYDSLNFDLLVGHRDKGEFVADEEFTDLTMVEDDDNYALSVVNDSSAYIVLALGDDADLSETTSDYTAATMVSAALDDSAPTYFSSVITGPVTLSFNINGLGAQQITLNPADTTDPVSNVDGSSFDADAGFIAASIQAAVNAIVTNDAYQRFTCSYDGAANEFTLTSPRDNDEASAASIAVYDGDLARLLFLDSAQKASLTSGTVSGGATKFSSTGSGIPSLADTSLTITIGNQEPVTITLDPDELDLQGTSKLDDGKTVALAIKNAVNAANPDVTAILNFNCTYEAGNVFVLTSGSASSRVSGISVTDSALSGLLMLDAAGSPAPSNGREVNQGTATVISLQTLGALDQGQNLSGGAYVSPTALEYGSFYSNILRKVRDVSIMVVPGQQWTEDGSGNPVLSQTLAHCESMKNRILIIDTPSGVELDQAATVSQMGLPTSTYSVLYYPWVKVANPLYHVDKNPNAAKTVAIAPSAMAAGMWAKIDGKRGVWKAPAGVEAQLNGAAGLQFNVENLEQDQLNPLGINCYRKMPNFGSVIWGSRTLATKADPEWRYVPVRRTAIFIEQSIFNGIQWAVFEPNDHPLWGSLRSNIGTFMNGLFRAGAFQGATADEAFFVRCGLGDTMTQGDIDRGQVIVIVGFAPVKPAEFVIVRIQQKVGKQ